MPNAQCRAAFAITHSPHVGMPNAKCAMRLMDAHSARSHDDEITLHVWVQYSTAVEDAPPGRDLYKEMRAENDATRVSHGGTSSAHTVPSDVETMVKALFAQLAPGADDRRPTARGSGGPPMNYLQAMFAANPAAALLGGSSGGGSSSGGGGGSRGGGGGGGGGGAGRAQQRPLRRCAGCSRAPSRRSSQ